MTAEEFKIEMSFISSQTGRKFPPLAMENLWAGSGKSINYSIAHEATGKWLYEKSYFSLKDLEIYWNREAQAKETRQQRHKATERLPEITPANTEAMRKAMDTVCGSTEIPEPENLDKDYSEVREKWHKQMEKFER